MSEDNSVSKKPSERVVLTDSESAKVQKWLLALNERFDGAIRLTRSDLVNFIIREHGDEFNEHEIKKLETEFYSEIRWLNWATTKVRAANKDGIKLNLNELIAKRPTTAPGRPSKASIKSRKMDLKNDLATIPENEIEQISTDSASSASEIS